MDDCGGANASDSGNGGRGARLRTLFGGVFRQRAYPAHRQRRSMSNLPCQGLRTGRRSHFSLRRVTAPAPEETKKALSAIAMFSTADQAAQPPLRRYLDLIA